MAEPAAQHGHSVCCRAARDAEEEERVVPLPTKTMDGQLVYEKRTSGTRPKLVKVCPPQHDWISCSETQGYDVYSVGVCVYV